MTRDELREKVAKSICNDWGYFWDGDPDDMQVISENDEPYDERPSRKTFRLAADGVIDTIFAALKEPTDGMLNTVRPVNGNRVWKEMLSASPLAPSKETK